MNFGDLHIYWCRGRSPYNTASLNPVLPSLSGSQWRLASFFLWAGFLKKNALQTWWTSLISLKFVRSFILCREIDDPRLTPVTLALLCFFFPFTLNHFNLGQFSITINAVPDVLCVFRRKANGAGWRRFFLALALSKPQLGMIAVFGLSVFYFQTQWI